MMQSSRVDFSFRSRTNNLARLRAEQFDLLIIGGGITGAGIARDAALRGYKVALVEKDDFASGTSSKSTKLVHGGLRYLETYQFHLVYEASRERRLLNHVAPNLVRPLPFIYPIYRGALYGPFLTGLGMYFYDGLALFKNFGSHQMLSSQQIGEQVDKLDVSQIIGGASYYDAQTDDARLTLENIRSAHRHGVAVANHFFVDGLLKARNGKVNGARGHDALTGEQYEIRARIVVNATGPWADSIRTYDDSTVRPRVRPSKGVHIYVPRERFYAESAVTFRVPFDGRLMFSIPWGRQTMIGTTDTFFEGDPDQVDPTPEDIAYILKATNAAFPRAHMTTADVISAFAGLRPLIANENANGPGAISREHKIWVSDSGLVNIAGGKLTTYRSMAAELVNKVAPRLRDEFKVLGTPANTEQTPLVETDPGNERERERMKKTLPSDVLEHLDHFYGPRLGRVLDYVSANSKGAERIVEGLPYIWAEVPHAIENEMAMNVCDVLERRLHLLYEAPDGGEKAAYTVAHELERRLDWTEADVERELNAYSRQLDRSRSAIRQVAVAQV